MSAEEWQARIDLAAAHRIAGALGWTQANHNHFTLRVPDAPRHFLIKPNDMMFEEVSASSLIKLDLDGAPVDESDNVNSAGFPIHGAVLMARSDVNAVAHIHTDAGMAISAHPDGLRFITQRAMTLYGQLGYHEYSGRPEIEDRDDLQRSLGRNKALILKHHGTAHLWREHGGGGIADALPARRVQVTAPAGGGGRPRERRATEP